MHRLSLCPVCTDLSPSLISLDADKAFLFLTTCSCSLNAPLSGKAAVGFGATSATRQQLLHLEGGLVFFDPVRLHH